MYETAAATTADLTSVDNGGVTAGDTVWINDAAFGVAAATPSSVTLTGAFDGDVRSRRPRRLGARLRGAVLEQFSSPLSNAPGRDGDALTTFRAVPDPTFLGTGAALRVALPRGVDALSRRSARRAR